MLKCEWCGNDVDLTYKVTANSETYDVCGDCKRSLDRHVCRSCGELLNGFSLRGLCMSCAQVEQTERERKISDPPLDPALSNGGLMTDEEFNNVMNFLTRNYDPDARKEFRRNWVRNVGIQNGWFRSKKEIEDNITDIDVVIEEHFEKLVDGEAVLGVIGKSKVKGHKIAESGKIYLASVK